MSERDYGKNAVRHIGFREATIKAREGWLIAREGWDLAESYVFLTREGTFTAKDMTTGFLGEFFVMRYADGTYGPWVPEEADRSAQDWAAISRQAVTRDNWERLPEWDTGTDRRVPRYEE